MKKGERAWAEIDLDAIKNNIRRIRDYVRPEAKILCAVKADGYGHGYLQVARTLLDNGADWLAVACIDEAVQLRRCGIRCPILILGHVNEQEAETIVKEEIIPACFSYELAVSLSRAATRLGVRAKIHVKLDTGMGRVGLRYTEEEAVNQETVDTILKMAVLPGLDIDGIFTHFSSADEGEGDDYTKMQYERFRNACDRLKASGLEIPIRHCCNSAALIRFPEMHLDMVRPGVILYGIKPAPTMDCGRLHLKPAMQFKAKITHVKEVGAGVSVSYGRKFETDKVTKIATIPVGYADGYSRLLSGKSQVIVGGKICNVIGNICMDQCMIDVSSVNTISVGDDVILFGRSDGMEIPVESLAEKMGTINYEILCIIGKRIPRIYLKDGEVVEEHNYLLDTPIPPWFVGQST